MDVKVARSSGFCFGVKRAMDLALKAAIEEKCHAVFTDGPLIHNPQALELLRSKGITPLTDIQGTITGTIIIRSHGVSPQRRQALEKTGANILDATCPKVKQVQSVIAQHTKQGFFVVIIGDKKHAEVKGLMGFAKKNSLVIQSVDELSDISLNQELCVVAQTTQNREKFLALKKKIKKKFPRAKIFDTICDANRKRQEELKSLCHIVEVMLVVGGKESGNTKRLVEIAQAQGIPTLFGENQKDFDFKKLKRFQKIGVIGGASTPDWVLEEIVSRLTHPSD